MDLEQVQARGSQVTVVSAVIERGIVRGIAHFTSVRGVTAEVQKAVGVLETDVQWSTAIYRIPSYFKRMGGFTGWDIPSGIFLFRWNEDFTTDWTNPAKRYALVTPELLFVPSGWTGGWVNDES